MATQKNSVTVTTRVEDDHAPTTVGGNKIDQAVAEKKTGWCGRGFKAVQTGCTKAWGRISSKDQRQRLVHPMKVGVALGLASLLMLLNAPDVWLGNNAIWAVMTVVVVFESSVGATVSKALNRGVSTALAGFLALGMEEIADACDPAWEVIFISTSVMLVGVICTSMRCIPSVKAKYDYGLVIFMLTYSLILVSGYQISLHADIKMAWERLFVIILACSICLIISMAIFPVWCGKDLHNLVASNFDDLALALEECARDYVKGTSCKSDLEETDIERPTKDVILGKLNAILGSGSSMDTLANQAIWEPFHCKFGIRHPWKEYVKLGKNLRQCTLAVLTMDGCLNSGMQITPNSIPPTIKMEMIYAITEISKLFNELGTSIRKFHKCGEKKLITKAMRHATSNLQTTIDEHLQLVFATKVIVPKILVPTLWRSFSTYNAKLMTFENPPMRRTYSCASIKRSMSLSPLRGLKPRPRNSKPPKIAFISKLPTADQVAIIQSNTTTIDGVKSVSLATFASLLEEIVKRLDVVVDVVHELGTKAKFKASHEVPFVNIV